MNSKKNLSPKLKLCAIIDKDDLDRCIVRKKMITSIQLRRKNVETVSLIKKIKALRKRHPRKEIYLFVNDRIDAAFASGADGLHLGRGDMNLGLARKILGKKCIIGKTVRNEMQAKAAENECADYVSIGPVFKTPLKKQLKPKGLKTLEKVRGVVGIPLIAIGGINFSNMPMVLAKGASGVAMMRGIKVR